MRSSYVARHFDFSVHQLFYSFLKRPALLLVTSKIFGIALNSSIVAVHKCIACCGLPMFHSTVSMTLLRSHSTLIRSFHVSALGTTRNLTVLSNSKCTNTLEHARNSRGKPLYAGLVFQSIPCAQTEILEPLVCDPEQEKIHRANLDRIKAFLTSLKPSDQSLTMNDFLTL